MKHIHFLISLSIWLLAFLPVVAASFIAVPFLILCTGWAGASTWFGNRKYPMPIRHATVTDPEDFLQTFNFYCLRNPVSNFGHDFLSISSGGWEYTDYVVGPLTFNFGWKLGPVPPFTFKFRPRLKKGK